MAELQINISEIRNNIKKLSTYLKAHNIQWSLITKVFSGDTEFMEQIFSILSKVEIQFFGSIFFGYLDIQKFTS